MKGRLAAILLLSAMPALADQPVLSDQQKTDEIRNMHWVTRGAVALAASKSSISLPPDYVAVGGAEARRFDFLLNARNDPTLEAVVVNGRSLNFVVFDYLHAGYVTTDDWNDVDAGKMLDQISAATEEANLERRKQNIEELHVAGWLRPPVLDRRAEVAFWALLLHSASGDLVNAIALRLGRYGYEKMTWVTDPATYKAGPDDQKAMLQAHRFDAGAGYEDHIAGDKLAGSGIASLVALAAGAKLAKVAGLGALLLLAKKFGIVIVAVLAGAVAWLRGKFTRRPGA